MKERQMRGPRDEAGDLWEGDVQTGAGRVLGGTGRSLRGDAVSIGTDVVRNREKTPRLPRILTTRWTEGEIGLDSEAGRDSPRDASAGDHGEEALEDGGHKAGGMWQREDKGRPMRTWQEK